MVMDTMDSFSNEAGDLMEKVYQYRCKSATCISSDAHEGRDV